MEFSPDRTSYGAVAASPSKAYRDASSSYSVPINDNEPRPRSHYAASDDCHSLRRLTSLARRAGALSPCIGRNSVSLGGANRLCSQTTAHQRLVKAAANALHNSILSSSFCLVGFDANGKDLTRGSQPLSPRGKDYD